MDKIKKGIFIAVFGLVLLASSLLVSSCGEDANGDVIVLNVNEVTLVLNDDSSTEVITANKSSSDFLVFYKLSKTEIVKMETLEIKNNYNTYKISPLSEGDVTITFAYAENPSAQTNLVVHVRKRVEQVSFKNEGDIYVARGGEYKIKTDDVVLYPVVNLFDNVEFSIEENIYGLKVSSNGSIDASMVTSECRVLLTAKSKFNSEVQASKYVSVITPIDAVRGVELVDNTNAVYYTQGIQVGKLELVKASENLSYKILNVSVYSHNKDDLTYSCSVEGTSVQAVVSSGELTLQSVNIGESIIHVFVVQTKAINYFEPVEIVIKVNVIELPTTLLLNGSVITNEIHYVYDYYDEELIGLPFSVQAYPSASADDLDQIKLVFADASYFKLLKKVGTDVIDLDLTRNEVVINASDELYLRAANIDSLLNSSFTITAISLLAEDYGIDVRADIRVELKKGIKSIFVTEEVRLKVGQSTEELYILAEPANADLSGLDIRTSSNKISVTRLTSDSYKITANATSETYEYVYFSRPNGNDVSCRVIVFEALEYVKLEVDGVLSGNVSDKTYEGEDLTDVVVKLNQRVNLFKYYNEGATISSFTIEGVNETGSTAGISLARDASYFECIATGKYKITFRAQGYDVNGEPCEKEAILNVECFKAITGFSINKNNAVCYTANSVGYHKSGELSTVTLLTSVSPLDAKFASDITWYMADEMGADIGDSGYLNAFGNYAEFKANDIDIDVYYVVITAKIQQYSESFVVTCKIKITKAIQVSQVVATNVANQNLYFDSRKGLNAVNATRLKNTYQINTSVYPSNALNKIVRYEYRTLTNEITSDVICGITETGLVIPYKAGRCKVLICAEDSYSSSTVARVYTIVYITIQDGKSLETAFHITTPEEFVAIGENASTMSYYYIVTQNIDMSNRNFTTFNLPFTGYITGRVAYRYGNDLNYQANREIASYYSIYGINLNYQASSGRTTQPQNAYVGLFSSLDTAAMAYKYDGAPEFGTVEDLSINYKTFNVDLTRRTDVTDRLIFYIGGLCGYASTRVGYAPIKNVKVSYNTSAENHQIKLGICTTYIGGVIGFIQDGNIEYFDGVDASNSSYLCRGAVVSGSDMTVIINENFKTVACYVGGYIGYANNLLFKSRYYGINNNSFTSVYSSAFASDYVDVTMNINVRISNAQEGDTDNNCFVGAIVGVLGTGELDSVAVENKINALENVGGFVGQVRNITAIKNSFASSKINAKSQIGGFVGSVLADGECTITASYAQNYDDGITIDPELPILTGEDSIGGFVGFVAGDVTIQNSYTASYITRSGFVGDIVATELNAKIGGLVGYVQAGDVIIDKCYTNYLLNNTHNSTVTKSYGFMANASGATISNSYIINSSGQSVNEANLNNTTNCYYSYTDDNGKVYINFKNSYLVYNSLDEIDNAAILAIKDKLNNVVDITNPSTQILDTDVYAIKVATLPYLLYNGNGLVELAPESIEAVSSDGAESIIFNVSYDVYDASLNHDVTVTEKVLVLEYYKSLDSTKQKTINDLNVTNISHYITMNSIPTDGYVKRYITSSEDKDVVAISESGEFVVNGVGQTIVTIRSKLNYLKQDTIRIVVIYATDGFALYDNQTYQDAELTSISMFKGETMQIYPTIKGFTYRANQINEVQAKVESDIYVEYIIDNNEYLDGSETRNYISMANNNSVGAVHSIIANKETGTVNVTIHTLAYIKLNIDGNISNVYLKDILFKHDELGNAISYTTLPTAIIVKLGATGINVVGSNELRAQTGDTITTTVRVYTTDENEQINFGVYNANGERVATCTYNSSMHAYTFVNSNKKVLEGSVEIVEKVYDANNAISYVDYSISLSLYGRSKELSADLSFMVRINPVTNTNLMDVYNITFYPANVNRIEVSYYTYGLKKIVGEQVTLNSNESARDMILPGTSGLLIIDLSPYYANYDYVEVTCDEKLNITQSSYNPYVTGGAFPYQDYTSVSYLSNGIRLANIYYSEDESHTLLFGKSGRYYVYLNAPTDTLIKKFTIKVKAYRVTNGQTINVCSVTKELDCENLPVIKLSYRGENSSDIQDIYIPKGITDDLSVEMYNVVSEPIITIATVNNPDITYNFVSVYKENGTYKINVNKNAGIGDNVLITFTCYKQVGEEMKVTTSTIQFVIVPYLIADIGFELVESGVMHEQFGGNFKLALSLEKSKIIYDETDENVKALIESDFNKVSGYDYNTWYAYRQVITGSDYSIGAYYENEYLTIKTLSSISKDLYVTGNYYDEFDDYQKYIGVNLKYYFDKSTNSYMFSKLVKTSPNRIDVSPYTFTSIKTLQNGRYYFEQSKFFFVSFYMNTSFDNAKPIYNVQEFQNMQAGMSYILMRNLELSNFVPISARIAYLNGNGKTITITSFDVENTTNIGIFEYTDVNTIIENLNIVIANKALRIDAQDKTNVTYGTIAANNYGKIYNCSISYTYSVSEEMSSYTTTDTSIGSLAGSTDWVNSMKNGMISSNATGICVQITVSDDDTEGASYVSCMMGALCGYNTGYITNCRVESGLNIHGYGVIGGIVGQNGGTIASSYSKARVNSYSTVQTYSSVGGFVGRNTGIINLSYSEHKNSASSTNGIINTGYVGINSATTSSGFVHTNTGKISNCYSNLRVSSSAASAGFVFDNNNGLVDNCYSACFVRENSKRDMAFVGVDSYNQINSEQDGITNCYFMRGNFANQDTQIAKPVSASEFGNKDSFTTFAFSSNTLTSGSISGFATAGVWMIPQVSNSNLDEVSGIDVFVGQTFRNKMPTLVSANQVSKGYVELISSSRGEDGNPEYKYSALIGATLGSSSHPYVIYSTADLNKYIKEGTSSTSEKINNKQYVLASDITFREETKMAQTYYVDFKGVLNGNGMKVSALRISYVDVDDANFDTTNFGLFKSLNGATIQNVNLEVAEVYGSVVQNVGVLAGTISNSLIYNINFTGDAVIQGKNLVGALAGVVGAYNGNNHVNDSSEIKNITSTLTASATYKQNISVKVGDNVSMYNSYAYAGGLIGLLASNSGTQTTSIANLKVYGGAKVLGDVAGGIVGYIGEKREIAHVSVIVDNDMYLKGTTALGGIAGVSQGTINYANVEYTSEVQEALDDVSSVQSNGTKSNVGNAIALSNNSFFIYVSNGTYTQNGVIGGVVGISANSTIENCYNKVNIVDDKACIMGGVVGQAMGGSISYCYSSCVIDGGMKTNVSNVRLLGGIVGLSGINMAQNGVLSYFINKCDILLTLNNVVSVATFNKKSYESYIVSYLDTNTMNTLYYYPMVIGGVIGVCDSMTNNNIAGKVSANNVYYNQYMYNDYRASGTNGNDIKINAIGAQSVYSGEQKEKFIAYSFTMENMVNTDNTFNLVGSEGINYISIVSDGIKQLDGDYYTYKPFDNGSVGKKTEVFAPFIIDGYYEFTSMDAPTPTIKQIEKVSTLNDLFRVDGNNIYLQGADLYKAALITNSNSTNWQNINGFYGYTLILNANVQLNNGWVGFSTFKGTLDGNGKSIDFEQKSANNSGLIVNGNGAYVKNLTIKNMTMQATQTNIGLIQNATNITLDSVAVYVIGVDASGVGAESNKKAGALVGLLKGKYNVINRSYVVFKNKVKNANLGAFVGECTGSVTIQASYSQNSESSTTAISLFKSLASDQTLTIANSVLYNNNATYASLVTTNNGTIQQNKVYIASSNNMKDENGTSVGSSISASFFQDNSKWNYNEMAQSPYNQVDVWKFEDGAVFPIHNFDDNMLIIYDGIGDYNDATKTYTMHNSLNLYNLSNLVNNGTLANGGDGFRFVLDSDLDGLHFVTINGIDYYIYDYVDSSNRYIKYSDGLQYKLTINNDNANGSNIVVNGSNVYGQHITKSMDAIGTEARPFRGMFDGDLHTIKNITFNGSVSSTHMGYVGVFGKIQDATIKNLIIENCDCTLTNWYQNPSTNEILITQDLVHVYAGGLVGLAMSSEINGVAVGINWGIGGTEYLISSKVSLDIKNVQGKVCLGGIAGFAQTITIKNVLINVTTNISIVYDNSVTGITQGTALGKVVGYLIRNQAYISNINCNVKAIDEGQATDAERYPALTSSMTSHYAETPSCDSASRYYGEIIETNNDVYQIV